MKICKCGCGNIVKTPWKEYARGCKTRGKTYLEIYGTDTPNNGYKSGDLNIAKRPAIKAIISSGVTKSYTPELRALRRQQGIDQSKKKTIGKLTCVNKYGEHYRSSLEVQFSELLRLNLFDYKYEHRVLLNNGRVKVVDFKVGDTLIEISGYAYPKWKTDFNTKINLLRDSCNNHIMILTYGYNTDELMQHAHRSDIFIGDVDDTTRIVEHLRFAYNIDKINQLSLQLCN